VFRYSARRAKHLLCGLSLLSAGFLVGHSTGDPLAAQTGSQAGKVVPASAVREADKRVVAYLHGNMPIGREEFGNYLIQYYGKERIRLYVNSRIIEMAAQKRGIVVTPQEIDAIIEQDCGKMGVTKSDFVHTILKQKYGKTIDEWRNDVIRPRLMLAAMCREQITLTEPELKKVYENIYGEKVVCKIIMWTGDQKHQAFRRYDAIRNSNDEFDTEARRQPNSDLSARGGLVDPIGRHSGAATSKIEEVAFKLKEGELSEVIDAGHASLVIKCVKRIPARTEISYEQAKPHLVKELTDRLLEIEIPKQFKKLQDEADPLFVLNPIDLTTVEQEHQSKKLLGVDIPKGDPKAELKGEPKK
jgi:hypothetical protein